MHVSCLDTPVVTGPEQMYPKHAAGRKVHSVRSSWHGVVGEQSSTVDLKVGHDRTPGCEIPLQIDGIEPQSVSGVGGLKNKKHGHSIDRIFKSSFQEAGAVRTRQDPPIAQSQIPNASILRATRNGVSASRPEL